MPAALILVVDDNGPLRYALSRTLREHGFDVVEAPTGADALRLAASDAPDLVLLDVNLPDIHGFDVARRLKQAERTKAIPILQISASFVEAEHRVEGLAAGADGYLVEPVEPGELVANIRALLRMRDAEAGLQRTTAMLAAVVEASPLAIVVFDREAVVRSWNPAAERLFGYTTDEVIGHPGASAGPGLLDETVGPRLLAGEPVGGIEHRYRCKGGIEVEVSIFAAPLERTPEPGFVAIIEDISGRRQYERERAGLLARERDARRDAEAASRLKDEFLATLSHELRTPLNAIMGWVSMLRDARLDPERRERGLEVIERNLRSQEQLISDILEVSRIIRGQMRLNLAPVDVVAAVQAAIDSVTPTATAKSQALNARLPQSPILVAGDPQRLQQVFWNLLTNATKYTPRDGRIDVAVELAASDVEVTVRDSGVGIAPHVLPYVFDRFRQGDSAPTREFGGLGLGLAIVRHLTELHGGSVRAASDGPGQGAVFTVTLPVTAGR